MAEKNLKESQISRGLRVLEAIFSDPINGVSNKEVEEKTKLHAVEVCRRLQDLEEAKWAEKNDLDRWTPTVKTVGLLKKYNLYLNAVSDKIESFEARTNAYARR